MCSPTEEVWEARKAYACQHKLVGRAPSPACFGRTYREQSLNLLGWCDPWPDYDGLTPEEAKAKKKALGEAMGAWWSSVHKATNKIPCCAWRPSLRQEIERFGFKQDYQLLSHLMDAADEFRDVEREHKPSAHAYQSLVKNFFSGKAADGKGRAKGQRRKADSMPIQVRSGDCFKLGSFGARGMNPTYYNCAVKFPGVPGLIRGRLPGRAPWGRVLSGVSITKQADGWWAAIKQEIPLRVLPKPVKGTVVGIDVGLYVIAAFNCGNGADGVHVDPTKSGGMLITNPRGKVFAEMIAGRQAQDKPVGRVQQRATRQTRHLIYNDIVKALEYVETIRVEKLPPKIGHMGSDIYSVMRKVVQHLKERYGDRVQERDPAYTSQLCSECGHHSKATWEWRSGESPVRVCPVCGAHKHRDHNAACNIALPEDVWSARLVKAGLRAAEKEAA